MKVIVFGATGFIGSSVAQAFARAGHITYGTSRSASAKQLLISQEIVPLICDPSTEEGKAIWGPIAETADVLVDCTSAKSAEQPLALVEHFKSLISARPAAAPKPTYIYTGGLWSWTKGPGGLDKWTDERQPRTGENTNVAWRKDVEDPILLETAFNGVVIRPPMLYGKTGSFVGGLTFKPFLDAKKGEVVEVLGKDVTRWQTIHQDDIGEAYRLVAEVGHLAKGQTFLPSNPQTERLTDILDALLRVSGKAAGYKLKDPSSAFEGAWVSTLNAHPSLLTALTGWRPNKLGLVDGIDLYWASYVASQAGSSDSA